MTRPPPFPRRRRRDGRRATGHARLRPVRADQVQLGVIGNGILGLAGSLDAATSIPGPSGAVYVASRELGDLSMRVILLLWSCPSWRFPPMRRSVSGAHASDTAGAGITALALRVVPWLVASAIGVVLARAGLMPGLFAGEVPLPADAPILVRSLVGPGCNRGVRSRDQRLECIAHRAPGARPRLGCRGEPQRARPLAGGRLGDPSVHDCAGASSAPMRRCWRWRHRGGAS